MLAGDANFRLSEKPLEPSSGPRGALWAKTFGEALIVLGLSWLGDEVGELVRNIRSRAVLYSLSRSTSDLVDSKVPLLWTETGAGLRLSIRKGELNASDGGVTTAPLPEEGTMVGIGALVFLV